VQLVLARRLNVTAASSTLAATWGTRLARGDYANVAAMGSVPKDNGSPVYQLACSGNVPTSVMAYGAFSSSFVTRVGPLRGELLTYVAPLDDLTPRAVAVR